MQGPNPISSNPPTVLVPTQNKNTTSLKPFHIPKPISATTEPTNQPIEIPLTKTPINTHSNNLPLTNQNPKPFTFTSEITTSKKPETLPPSISLLSPITRKEKENVERNGFRHVRLSRRFFGGQRLHPTTTVCSPVLQEPQTSKPQIHTTLSTTTPVFPTPCARGHRRSNSQPLCLQRIP